MSTGILTTLNRRLRLRAAGGRLLGRGCGGRVADRAGVDPEEEGTDPGHEPDDAEDQADDRKGPASQRASAGRDSLPGDETHDRGGGAQDDAEARDRADDRHDPDDQRGDREPIRALARVTRVAGAVSAAGGRRHVAAAESPSGRRWIPVASAGGRGRWRRRVVATAVRGWRGRGWWRFVTARRRRRNVRHSKPPRNSG